MSLLNDLSYRCIRASISIVYDKHVKADWYKPCTRRETVSVAQIPSNTAVYWPYRETPSNTG